MKTYTLTLSDGGADGIPPFSETVTVSIENGETHDPDTLRAFIDSVGMAAAVDFGANRPRVTVETEGEPERRIV